MADQKITITLKKREGKKSPYLTYKTSLERYEAIGVLTLALDAIKDDALSETKTRFK